MNNAMKNQSLFECHGHLMMDGVNFQTARKRHAGSVDKEQVKQELLALSLANVTYFRDGGDALGVSDYARTIAADYGIRYATPLFAIHKTGHYGGIVGRGYSDLEEYRKLVEQVRTAGGDFIKIMISGIITFQQYGELSCPSLPAEEISDLIHIAHDAGFPIMIHVNGDNAIRAAISAGADSIEHGVFIEEETIELLAGSHTIWVPTAAAIAAFSMRNGMEGVPPVDQKTAERTLERHLRCIGLASRKGACIAAGSDSGAVGVPHGRGTLDEYRLLARAGVTAEELESANKRIETIFH